MKSDSLENCYLELIKKYPFLKNFIEKDNKQTLTSPTSPETNEFENKILSLSNYEFKTNNQNSSKENDFKQRCLVSLLLKHEITEKSSNNNQDISLTL